MLPAETVFFAIQAGVRLYEGLRTAYVDAVRDSTITLPLPRAPGIELDAIAQWFFERRDGRHRPAPESTLGRLLARIDKGLPLNAEEQAAMRQAYAVCWAEANPSYSQTEGGVSLPTLTPGYGSAEYFALLEVRQWAEGQDGASRSTFQQVAGTLINVAVYWFANKPGAVSTDHPEGRVLLAFLGGVQDVDFARGDPHGILGRMLVGVLDGVASEPRLLAGGRREEQLVSSVSAALARAVAARFAERPPTAEAQDAASWIELVARTMLRAGADTALADPNLFFGVKHGDESAVIGSVGRSIVNLLLPDGTKQRIDLGALVSGTGLETVVRAALNAVATNPGVLGLDGDRQGLEALLADLAGAFSAAALPPTSGGAFPEVARLVLEKTATHLDAVWGGDKADVARNVLVLATRRTLEGLARYAGGARGSLFARDQLVAICEAVLDEVTENPHWVVSRIGEVEESKNLSVALEAMLAALHGQKLTAISGATAAAVLTAGLQAAALQLPLLSTLPPDAQGKAKTALQAVVEAIFEELGKADADTKWRIARASAIVSLTEAMFAQLGQSTLAAAELQDVVDAVRAATAAYAKGGESVELFGRDVAKRLIALG